MCAFTAQSTGGFCLSPLLHTRPCFPKLETLSISWIGAAKTLFEDMSKASASLIVVDTSCVTLPLLEGRLPTLLNHVLQSPQSEQFPGGG